MYKSCGCLSDCNAITYDFDITIGKISAKFLQNYTNERHFMLESEVLVFYSDNEYVGFRRVLRSEVGGFLANFGAFLWLFLGASVLSIVEVIYFFTLRFFNNLWID